jgi:hypothetical protein
MKLDQLVPLHHHAHFMYPACLFFLYMLIAAALLLCTLFTLTWMTASTQLTTQYQHNLSGTTFYWYTAQHIKEEASRED